MKDSLIFSFLLILNTNLFAQVPHLEISRYNFDVVKGVDSIILEYIGGSSSSTWKDVSHYEEDRRKKLQSFDDGQLHSYKLFQYDDRQNVRYEAYYGKTSQFDSDKNEWIGLLDPTSCSLTIKKHSNGKLIEEMDCTVDDGDTTINRITTYTYDKNRRLLSEATKDVFVGLVGSFKSNSVELNELRDKKEEIVYSKLFSYEPRRVMVIYKVDVLVTGKEIITLNLKGQVTAKKQFDNKNKLLSEISAVYDQTGRLKSTTWKTYGPMTTWGYEADVISDGIETIEYDSFGRPTVVLRIYVGDHKNRTVYHYY